MASASLLRAVRALDLSLSMGDTKLKPGECSVRCVQDKHGFKGVLGAPFLKRDVGCRLVPKPGIFCLGARHPAPGQGCQPTLLHCALACRAHKKQRNDEAFDSHMSGVVFSGLTIATLAARHRVRRGAMWTSWCIRSSRQSLSKEDAPPLPRPITQSVPSLRRSHRLVQTRSRLALPLTP